jgi:ketosteroid isomerase-like protein
MKRYLPIIFLAGLCAGCTPRQKNEDKDKALELKISMMDADRAFSKLSQQQGMRSAFLAYLADDAVLLRPGNLPLEGGEALDLIIQGNDTTDVLTWEPKNAQLSQSADIGYTYGLYSRKPANEDTIYYGTYVTIWKRMADGKWKFILQSGNEGLE